MEKAQICLLGNHLNNKGQSWNVCGSQCKQADMHQNRDAMPLAPWHPKSRNLHKRVDDENKTKGTKENKLDVDRHLFGIYDYALHLNIEDIGSVEEEEFRRFPVMEKNLQKKGANFFLEY